MWFWSYVQSHPAVPLEERSKLCRCLNYEKLSLETCKDLAKNPRIPPTIAIQALRSQHSNICTSDLVDEDEYVETLKSKSKVNKRTKDYQMVLYNNSDEKKSCQPEKEVKVNLERMQGRVVELEKVCREMRVQMARMAKMSPQQNRQLPRMCWQMVGFYHVALKFRGLLLYEWVWFYIVMILVNYQFLLGMTPVFICK